MQENTDRYGKITEQPGESRFKRFIHSIVTGCLTCGCLTVLFFAALLAAGIYLFSSDSSPVAKCGRSYEDYDGVAIECQNFPDAPNKEDYPSAVLRPGEIYGQAIIFAFGVRK